MAVFTIQAVVEREGLLLALAFVRTSGASTVDLVRVDTYEQTPGDANTRKLRLRAAEEVYLELKATALGSWSMGSAKLNLEELERAVAAIPTSSETAELLLSNDPQFGALVPAVAVTSATQGLIARKSGTLEAN